MRARARVRVCACVCVCIHIHNFLNTDEEEEDEEEEEEEAGETVLQETDFKLDEFLQRCDNDVTIDLSSFLFIDCIINFLNIFDNLFLAIYYFVNKSK